MILEQLREHTSAAHRALEAQVKIDEATASAARYQALLERFLGFYEPMEARFQTAFQDSGHGYDAQARIKSPWLKADLRELGLDATTIAALPQCKELPSTTNAALAFGCAYVLEGSTLGGKHIARMIECSPAADLPHRFFTGYGPEVGGQWKEFCGTLERFASENPQATQQILSGAEQTFQCFQRWVQ